MTRAGSREEGRERERENADGIGRRIVNGNDGHRLSQRRRASSTEKGDGTDVESRLIAAINIKPTSRDTSPIHPLATPSHCLPRLCAIGGPSKEFFARSASRG